ncbi:MAG: hypothetical protein JW900_10145 [Anaerolineae bacterium]|nr:hypothetical protein [Anaerolineae bacterium]
MAGWLVFRAGLARALRYRRLVLVAYGANLLGGLALLLLPAAALAGGLGHRPAVRYAADGVDAWLVFETVMSPLVQAALGPDGGEPTLSRGIQQGLLLTLLVGGTLPLLAWLANSFLAGGVLLVYAEAPSPFRWRRFLWGCWHWLGAFLLLGLLQAAAGVALVSLGVFLLALAASAGGWLVAVILLAVIVLGLACLVLVEMTRAVAVVEGVQNVARALALAVRLSVRRMPALAGLYGLSLLLLAGVHGIYRWLLAPLLPLEWWLLALVVLQLFVLARLLARLIRLAGGIALLSKEERDVETDTDDSVTAVLAAVG